MAGTPGVAATAAVPAPPTKRVREKSTARRTVRRGTHARPPANDCADDALLRGSAYAVAPGAAGLPKVAGSSLIQSQRAAIWKAPGACLAGSNGSVGVVPSKP